MTFSYLTYSTSVTGRELSVGVFPVTASTEIKQIQKSLSVLTSVSTEAWCSEQGPDDVLLSEIEVSR